MFKGSFVAIITPFKNGKVDYETLGNLIEFHIKNGTHGIVPCGTTGESPTLTFDEHKEIITFTVEKVNGRIPVIAGTGSNNTAEALFLTRHAKDVGADGALIITPYYNKPTQEGLYQHFSFLAREVDIPILIYNVPGRTGVSISPETVIRLAEIENIVGIKDATGTTENVSYICSKTDLDVLSGDDPQTLPMMAVGAKGVISVAANIIPRQVSEMVEYALKGDMINAQKIHLKYFHLFKALFYETNPIPVKAAMELLGQIEKAEYRLPLCRMNPNNLLRLKQVMQQVGLI